MFANGIGNRKPTSPFTAIRGGGERPSVRRNLRAEIDQLRPIAQELKRKPVEDQGVAAWKMDETAELFFKLEEGFFVYSLCPPTSESLPEEYIPGPSTVIVPRSGPPLTDVTMAYIRAGKKTIEEIYHIYMHGRILDEGGRILLAPYCIFLFEKNDNNVSIFYHTPEDYAGRYSVEEMETCLRVGHTIRKSKSFPDQVKSCLVAPVVLERWDVGAFRIGALLIIVSFKRDFNEEDLLLAMRIAKIFRWTVTNQTVHSVCRETFPYPEEPEE